MLASERFVESSHVVRDLTAKLRRHRGFATSNLVAICDLERQLAEDFGRRGNFAESRALLMDSLDLLEGRRCGPDDQDVDEAYARALMELGWIAQQQQHSDEAMVWLQRAEDVLEALVHDPQHIEVIISINKSRRTIASLFGRSGLEEPRRRLLESHIGMLERLSERAGADPAIGLLAALVRLDLAPDDGDAQSSAPRSERLPANRRLPATAGSGSGELDCQRRPAVSVRPKFHRRIDRAASTRMPTPMRSSGRSNQDARRSALTPPCFPPRPCMWPALPSSRGAEQRKAGRLDDARQTAACLSAFAKTLVRRDPDEAAFHLVLCAAFVQESKNAWRIPDHATIEDGTARGIGRSLHRATSRSPKRGRAQRGRHSSGQAGRSRLQKNEAGERKQGRRSYFVPIAHLA